MKKILFFLVIFAIAAGAAGFYWNYKKNFYSKEVLKLEIIGPSETVAGETAEYIVKYKNNGNFRLESPELVFEPPLNSFDDGEIFSRQVLNSEKLGEAIYPGQEKAFPFKMKILGKEGDVKIARASLSYRPKNLKAKYDSQTSLTTLIKTVPLSLDFDLATKVEPGKIFSFKINYFSNINYALSDLRIQVAYPSGFEFLSSSPKSLEKVEWVIPLLNKSRGGRIEVQGKISGELREAKTFKAKIGFWKEGEFVLLKEAESGVEIVNPSLYVRQEVNSNPQYVARPGDWLHYEILFKNVGDDTLSNLFMVNKLEGEAFDFATLRSDSGNFQAGDNSIVFDWRKVSKLQYLTPTDEGKVDFWVKIKDDLGSLQNPVIKNKIFISQMEEEFVNKISSKLELAQKGVFQDEIFGNSGPLPPRVGEKTTYTVTWQAKNYYSDVKNAKAKAILPQEVELTGKIFPQEDSSKFSFDPASREIVWSLGDLAKGKGVADAGPNISFQVAFTPAFYQRGETPEIIGEVKITGEDVWTQTVIEATAPAANTQAAVQ